MDRTLENYLPIVGPQAVSQLEQLGRELAGSKVVHVNSTKEGGGVAEILTWLIPLMKDLKLDASWEVVTGESEYFQVTKTFHNGLQGNKVQLTPDMIATYEKTVEENAQRLRPILEKADYVFIHDPQPAALIKLCPNRKGKWIWRCHIDVSKPDLYVWKYIKSLVSGFDASIFSMPQFAQSLPHPQFIIAPSIDPLSEKNRELEYEEVNSILRELNIPTDVPILTQVSRFDRFKDPVGVIRAFRMLQQTVKARLILAGGGATDDPEGAAVLEEVKQAAGNEENIHILMLPSDAHKTINALQRASRIVIQKSTQEGFGLTVTEALWKGKPVIGGNVGGIKLQVHDHHTGYLVSTPEGAALRIMELINHEERIERIGQKAREFVKEYFLLNRHLREYLTLMLGLKRGIANYLVTQPEKT